MKSTFFYLFYILTAGVGGLSSFAQTNAFTYQGRLNVDGAPANGIYDLAFSLFATNITGSAVAGPTTNSSTIISNGLFITSIDFGPSAVLKPNAWLEISVRTNSAPNFVTLTPRQQLTPAPYALSAGSLASVTSVNFISKNLNETISGGINNATYGSFSTIAGGSFNSASVDYASIGGGSQNIANNFAATVSGGTDNQANGYGATTGGGQENVAAGDYATVGGGYNNTAIGIYSVIPGGGYNEVYGNFSFAAGESAYATHNHCFVWNDDSSGATYSSTAANQFCVHANGGIFLDGPVNASGGVTFATDMHMGVSSSDYRHFSIGGGNSYGYLYGSYPALGDGVHMGYNYYYDAGGVGRIIHSDGGTSRISAGYGDIQLATGNPNAAPAVRLEVTATTVTVKNATFNGTSDRNLKQDFTDVNPEQILNKVLALPVTEWSYTFDPATRHIGPVAQDFYSAFNIGTDDKHIAPMDEGGLAFAAIKGLNQKLEERDAAIQKLAARIEELEKVIKGR